MAIVSGLQGRIRGKLAESVFYGGKGSASYARAYVAKPKNPKTTRQLVSREIFKAASKLVSSVALAVKTTYGDRNKVLGKFAQHEGVVQYSTEGVLTIKYADIAAAISTPALPTPAFGVLDLSGDLSVTIPVPTSMPDYSQYMEAGAKLAYVVLVLQPDTLWSKTVVVMDSDLQNGKIVVPVPPIWSGTDVHVYAAVKEVLPAFNGVPTEQQPIKYPSKSSAFVYVGRGTIE